MIDRREIYRHHLRSCLEDMLNRVDAIMDYCYSDNVSNIDITISLNPDVEIPTVEYRALTMCTKGYGVRIPDDGEEDVREQVELS